MNYCSTVVAWSSNEDPSRSLLKEPTGLFLNIYLPLGMSILLVYTHRLLGPGGLTAVKYVCSIMFLYINFFLLLYVSLEKTLLQFVYTYI